MKLKNILMTIMVMLLTNVDLSYAMNNSDRGQQSSPASSMTYTPGQETSRSASTPMPFSSVNPLEEEPMDQIELAEQRKIFAHIFEIINGESGLNETNKQEFNELLSQLDNDWHVKFLQQLEKQPQDKYTYVLNSIERRKPKPNGSLPCLYRDPLKRRTLLICPHAPVLEPLKSPTWSNSPQDSEESQLRAPSPLCLDEDSN